MTVGISNFGVEDKQLLPIIELFQKINVVRLLTIVSSFRETKSWAEEKVGDEEAMGRALRDETWEKERVKDEIEVELCEKRKSNVAVFGGGKKIYLYFEF